jgi:hypothetical protein
LESSGFSCLVAFDSFPFEWPPKSALTFFMAESDGMKTGRFTWGAVRPLE